MRKTVLLTGGGTAGHVNPNIALLPGLRQRGFAIHYIGTEDGIEKELILREPDVTYHSISAGKLRRFASVKNLATPFLVIRGIFQSKRLIKEIKPDVVFSKGGFVSVPVVVAASKKAPVVCHESDYSPGLANRICERYADAVCVTFEDTLAKTGKKGIFTSTPIRAGLYGGDEASGLKFLGIEKKAKPLILIMGGSSGAQALNEAVASSLDALLEKYLVVHLCGRGKKSGQSEKAGYWQFEYLNEQLKDIFKLADIIVSRAGANAIFEFLALKKPSLLIPLPAKSSRGDQLQNADYFTRRGYSLTLPQEELTSESLLSKIGELFERRLEFVSVMENEPFTDGTQAVLDVIIGAMDGRYKK